MNETLMQIVVENAIFFGMAGDDVVDADTAVSRLEAMGAMLQSLSDDHRNAFLSFVQKTAASEGNAQRAEFLWELGENLGLS